MRRRAGGGSRPSSRARPAAETHREWRARRRASCSHYGQHHDPGGNRRAHGQASAAHLEQRAVARADDAHGGTLAESQSTEATGVDVAAPNFEHRRARAGDACRERAGGGAGGRSWFGCRNLPSGKQFEHARPARVENGSQDVEKVYSFRTLRSTPVHGSSRAESCEEFCNPLPRSLVETADLQLPRPGPDAPRDSGPTDTSDSAVSGRFSCADDGFHPAGPAPADDSGRSGGASDRARRAVHSDPVGDEPA